MRRGKYRTFLPPALAGRVNRMLMIAAFVPVPMMQIRVMRVLVPHRLVLMPMRVRFGHGAVMFVLVVIVLDMAVFVRKRFVQMFVLMSFGEM